MALAPITMTSYTLRPYQQHAVNASLAYLRNPKLKGRNGIVIAPTGSGKSLEIASIATQLDGPCMVFQPSKEILEQNLLKLAHYGFRPAVFSASMGRKEIGKITLATIGSVISHAEHFRHLPYVLIDEAHLVNAQGGQYREFLDVLGAARVLGLTATPFRLASNSFGSQLRFLTRTIPKVFRDVVHFTQIADLFVQGYLAPLAYRDATCINRARLKLNSTGADYTDASVRDLFGEVGFVGRLQHEVESELAAGRKNVLVFTRFVDEAVRLARVIPGAAVVTADTPSSDRERILADFKSNRLRVVSNVGVLGLGFDYPELECVILGRPSISLALFYQQVGRIIRPHLNKPVAHVVDMVGLVKQFGRIEDLTLSPGNRSLHSINAIDWASPDAVKAPYCQWELCDRDRPLTNCYFAERDNIDPRMAAKARAKQRVFAKRARAKRGG